MSTSLPSTVSRHLPSTRAARAARVIRAALEAERLVAHPQASPAVRASPQRQAVTRPRSRRLSQSQIQRAVQRLLKDFAPRGKKREKVETLRIEAVNLDVNKTPLAFCFVLRSMFEVSAKAFCADHAAAGLKATKSDGSDKSLADLLRDITNHLTKNNSDKAMVKALHGAMAELGKGQWTAVRHVYESARSQPTVCDFAERYLHLVRQHLSSPRRDE